MMFGYQLYLMAAIALFISGNATAQWKPQNPVDIVVASGPGGDMDKTARTMQVILRPAQIAYWDAVFRALAGSEPWKADLENNLWVNNYQSSADGRKYLAAEYNDYKIQLKDLGVIR